LVMQCLQPAWPHADGQALRMLMMSPSTAAAMSVLGLWLQPGLELA
jgi:hypothetical protein